MTVRPYAALLLVSTLTAPACAPAAEPDGSLQPRAALALTIGTGTRLPEVIVAPADIGEARVACVAQTTAAIERCHAAGAIFGEAAASITRPESIRRIALCLSTGCEDSVSVAPANACLWWRHYIDRHPTLAMKSDQIVRDEACASARFGDDARRMRITQAWLRLIRPR